MPYLILALCFGALATALLVFARWCFHKAFFMPKKYKKGDPYAFFGGEKDAFCKAPMEQLVKRLDEAPSQRVCITARDGLRLSARLYLAPKESDVLEIFFHGWRGTALRDGCGGGTMALDAGHHLLLVDQRAHGESDGQVITFGIKEKYDCLDWVNYAVDRFGENIKIQVSGISMGAATVMMAAALPLPPQVKGITADCGYTSPEAIIRKVCRDMQISDRIGYPFVKLAARLYGHFSLRDTGALEAVTKTKLPILIIHGTADDFVPYDMALALQAANPNIKLLSVPNAGHGLSFFYDNPAYTTAIREFQGQIFGE